MKERIITFPFDDKESLERKVSYLKTVIPEKDMVLLTEYPLPEVHIRCDKVIWNDIKFKLDLCAVYY